MKISCTQENLNQGLFIVSHIAGKNINLPILNNILLKTESGVLKLFATNLEIGISCIIRGKIEEEGEFTVPAKIISDYVNLLPKERVDIQLEDQNLKIECNNFKTKIRGVSATDFPLIPQIEKENPYICDAGALKQALAQVIFAVSSNETRPEISGVLFDFSGGDNATLTVAATDSYRLAERKIDLGSGARNIKIIVPARTVQELLRILGGVKEVEDSNLKIFIEENQILFVYDNIELVSRLIEGQYPDYQQIIPREFKTQIKVSTAELLKAVKTASLFSRSGIYDITLNFDPHSKEIVVSSVNNQLGENISRVDAEIQGENNSIILNYHYLVDGLNNINSPETTLELIESDNPCILRPFEDKKYLYIIMPIKQ
ncbi:MAG: DNA polymerase III subunit beta [Promethearchaeota archaeon]